jgi:hypothetical protein
MWRMGTGKEISTILASTDDEGVEKYLKNVEKCAILG